MKIPVVGCGELRERRKKMAIDFRVVPHSISPNTNIVEILVDGEVAGVVYPAGGKSIKLVSAHMEDSSVEEGFGGEVVEDDGSRSWPPIPAVLIQFNPSPYTIKGNKIVKLPLKK
jgi:hypothetical protein